MGIEYFKNFDVVKFLKRKDVLLNLLILVVVIFVSRAIYQHRTTLIAKLDTELKELQEASRISQELENFEEEFMNFKKVIPNETISTVSVVDRITDLAKKRSINISSITPRAAQIRDFYWEYPFEIEMSADFRQTGGFLSDLENSKDLFRVDYLNASANPSEAIKGTRQLKVRIVISAISWKA
jgi:Tfp pilus assembly protein PilO